MNDISDTSPSLDELRGITDNIRFILDAKACAKRAEELIGLTIAAQEAQAAAEKAQGSLAAAQAEIDAAQAALDERRKEYDAEGERWSARNATLDARAKELSEDGQRAYWLDRIKQAEKWETWVHGQIMRISHLDVAYASMLQSKPGLGDLVEEILHDHQSAQPEPVYEHDPSDAPVSMPVDALVAGTTLTRSERTGRRGADRRVES